MSKETELLAKHGFMYNCGYVRFSRGKNLERLSTFQFHVRELRDVVIHKGMGVHKDTGEEVEIIRLHIELIGGQSAHSGPYHPDSTSVIELTTAFLTLRDGACGLPKAEYEIETRETKFYGDVPFVTWDIAKSAE